MCKITIANVHKQAKSVKALSKHTLKKKVLYAASNGGMEQQSRKMPKVPAKYHTNFNKEDYVKQALHRSKFKVLNPNDVQEYYRNLNQFMK